MSKTPQKQISAPNRYWSERADMMYYNYVFYIARTVAAEGSSVLDVGSNRCSYLEWFYWMDRKVSLDQVKPYQSAGIEPIKTDFLAWEPQEKFDLVLCLQVLEHIPDVCAFARKLLECGHHVIISVPHEWPAGSPYHVHDPVTKDDVNEWMGREPNASFVVREIFFQNNKGSRLVAYYDTDNPKRRVRRAERENRRPLFPPDFYDNGGNLLNRPMAVEAFEQNEDAEIRYLAERVVPRDATILVVSRGDESLVGFNGRRGWHFPRTLEGLYAGYHPADSAQAIGHLEEQRARGATHLVFPNSAFWWFKYYPELISYLESHYTPVVVADSGVVFDIRAGTTPRISNLVCGAGGLHDSSPD